MDLVTSELPLYPGWQNLQTWGKSTGQEGGIDLTAKTWNQVMVTIKEHRGNELTIWKVYFPW